MKLHRRTLVGAGLGLFASATLASFGSEEGMYGLSEGFDERLIITQLGGVGLG